MTTARDHFDAVTQAADACRAWTGEPWRPLSDHKEHLLTLRDFARLGGLWSLHGALSGALVLSDLNSTAEIEQAAISAMNDAVHHLDSAGV